MKNILYILAIVFSITACKNETKQKDTTNETVEAINENDGLTLIEGDFIYYTDAAVLQTQTGIFGVKIDKKTKELANMAKPFQKEITDMVKVRIKGTIEPKPKGTEGWDFNVKIGKIISVKALNPKKNEIIKIGK